MLRSHSLLALAALGVSVFADTNVVYVTDLSIFTVLAPCAQAAVSGVINYETVSNCPSGAAGLQSCICSKNAGAHLRSVSSSILSSLDYTCGSTATDDQASAATVLSGYCNQAQITPFASPSHIVSQYVVDLPAYHNLAPCAQSGLGGIVLGMTWDRCNEDASLLATCACQKNQNSAWATDQISSSVKYNCDSHAADASSALEIFAGYCGLADGTTSFPETTNPPGDMTYYITALKEFKALPSCAQSAVSYNVQHQTDGLCPSGPQALASCACLRSEMTASISSSITSDARYYCSSQADDIASALNVWDTYCSAAKGLKQPAGVTESISQPQQTSTQSRSGAAKETGKGSSGVNGNNNADTDGKTPNAETPMSNTAVIAGAVVGAVVGTALIAVVAFLFYRRSKKAQHAAATTPVVSDNGKPELDSTAIVPPSTGSPSPSIMKSRMDNASPVSTMASPHSPPPMPELHNQAPRTPELHGQEAVSPQTPHEAQSQQLYEAHGQSRPQVFEAHGQPRSELGLGWQSGPVAHAYEMDASHPPPPHAQ
ncbi:hypothetical protein F4808DRAFT_424768 [Astrocystis sublimbata]|nr:hypothetical protein F4808DRAFT_424768 [Astrocystis sublimbata]